jgi:hypothetical protein
MPSKNLHNAESPKTQNQNNAMSDDPSDGHRLTDNPQSVETTAVEKPAPGDAQNQPTPEDFGKRGMGMAAKE